MTSEPLKLGFIGGALNSAVGETHKICSQMDNRWALTSGCFSRHAELNRYTAEMWGVNQSRVYANYLDLFEAEKNRLDAIAVLTPTPSHAEIVIAALEHGYPVICEKALAKSVEEAVRIEEARKRVNGYLAVTYNYTGYPMVRELREVIRRGDLGDLQQIHVEMPQEGFLRLNDSDSVSTPQDWRLKDHKIPTLSLDLGVHVHHMVNFLSAERPIELVALGSSNGVFENITDNTMCIARYTGDLDCQFWYGKTSLGHSNGLRVRVYGNEGSAEWFQLHPEELLLHNRKGGEFVLKPSSSDLIVAGEDRYNRFKPGHPTGFIEAFANLYYDLADSLSRYKANENHESSWVFGAEVALEGLSMLEAIAESAKAHSWQPVSTG